MRLLLSICFLLIGGVVSVRPRKAISVLYGDTTQAIQGQVATTKLVGKVEFSQESPDHELVVEITLFADSMFVDGLHGLHIHDSGNVYGGCSQELGHFNPHEVVHGGPNSAERHVGDFGNIDIKNSAYTGTLVDTVASLYGKNNILGRGIVLHEGQDDLGTGGTAASEATGSAGGRIACGVVGVNSLKFELGAASRAYSGVLALTLPLLWILIH